MKVTFIIASLVAIAFSAPIAPHTNRSSVTPHTNRSPAAPHTNRASPAPHTNRSSPAPHTNRRESGNFQTFTAALGGIPATAVVDSGNPNRPFAVRGDTFVNIGAALQRSCEQQFNACEHSANIRDAALSVSDCTAQKDRCNASVEASTVGS